MKQEDNNTVRYFFRFCLLISGLIAVYITFFLICFFLFPELASTLIKKTMVEYPGKAILIACTYITGVLWIKNLLYWYKNDKKVTHLFLLLMINWIYIPIYYLQTQWRIPR